MSDPEFNLCDPRPAFHELDAERKRLGFSVSQFQELTGVSCNSRYSWIKLQRSPTVCTLVKLAEAVDFEIILRRKK